MKKKAEKIVRKNDNDRKFMSKNRETSFKHNLKPVVSEHKSEMVMKKNGMVIMFALFLVCFLTAIAPAQAAYEGYVLSSYEWGSGNSDIGLIKSFDGYYGPSSFIVSDNNVTYILDTVNNRVKQIDILTGEIISTFSISHFARDIVITSEGELAVLYQKSIIFYSSQGKVLKTCSIPSKFHFISGLQKDNSGDVTIRLAQGDSLSVRDLLLNKEARFALKRGLIVGNKSYLLEKVDDSTGQIHIFDKDGIYQKDLEFVVDNYELGSLRLIGVDKNNTLYIDVELITNEAPISVNRQILIMDNDGTVTARINLPDVTYTYALRDLQVDKNGNIFQMLRDEHGVHIISWSVTPYQGKQSIEEAAFQPVNYNDLLSVQTSKKEGIKSNYQESDFKTNLTRTEALDIADTYVQHSWYASSCNIGYASCGGKIISTPSWVTVGSHTHVPYKWGGFSSLTEFDSGLNNCKYAGDNHCTGGGSSCAIGVDCSGFVSRCWKTSSKYGTSTLPNISYQISLSEMKAGDIFNKAGSHVRLFVSQNSNGTYNLAESYAGSSYWRVGYTVRTAADNSTYLPRRCNYIIDDYDPNRPGTMQNPIIIPYLPYSDSNTTVDGPSDLFDYYSCAPSTNESGPELFYKLNLTSPATITVTVSDGYGVDIDVHLLSGLSEDSCIARNDTSFTVSGLSAGTYYITADTWVGSSGTVYAGPYTMSVQEN